MVRRTQPTFVEAFKKDDKLKFAVTFSAGYLFLFSGLAIWNKNLEFLYYTAILWAIFFIVILYYKRLYLDNYIFLGLTFLGAFHLLGGHLYIYGTRLYDLYIIPPLLKYDNFVHAFGIFLVTFAVYSLLRPVLDDRMDRNGFLLGLLLVITAVGVGALNEILELFGVVVFDAADGVGDYYNNALDLLFNFLGATAAAIIIVTFDKEDTK